MLRPSLDNSEDDHHITCYRPANQLSKFTLPPAGNGFFYKLNLAEPMCVGKGKDTELLVSVILGERQDYAEF
jgi:hypothetical protein